MFPNLGIPKKRKMRNKVEQVHHYNRIYWFHLQESCLYDSNHHKQKVSKRVGTVLPILQHIILLQYGRNTNTISTFCTSHNTIEYRSQGSHPWRAEASLNTILLKTHHITIHNKNIENKDRYILKEFPYDGQIQRQSTSYYFFHHK